MKSLKILGYFMKLVRWPNLLMVIMTMFLMRYFVVRPMLTVNEMELQMSFFNFVLLVMATGFITAAGYIINDYFDRKTDQINKPYKVIVGRFIKRRMAMVMHTVFNIIGVLLGLYISFKNELNFLSIIYILTTGLLWFYSTTYKRQVLVGNLIVSILTAMVPLLVVLYELPLLNRAYNEELISNHTNLFFIVKWVFGFAYFAFLTTLIREIVKDTEDLIGDHVYGRTSIPIAIGEKYTRVIILILTAVTTFSIIFIVCRYAHDIYSLIYVILLLIFPIIYFTYVVIKATNKDDWNLASKLIKLIMVSGILYSLLLNYKILASSVI